MSSSWKKPFQGEFTKHVLTLMTGTIAGQALVFLFSPVITRLFTPDDFTTLELYTMITTVGVVVVTGKYEFAIMHPKDKEDARHILGLSIGLAAIMSLLLLGLSFLVNDWVGTYYENPTMGEFLWMVPIGLFCFAVFNSVNYWFSRQKNYKVSAVSKVWFSGASEPVKWGTGFANWGGFGLLLSTTIGHLVTATYCLYHFFKDEAKGLGQWEWERMKKQAIIHKDYPLFSIWGSILNRLAQWAHVGIFTYYFGLVAIGYMALCRRVFQTPLNVISSSFGQVFFQKISEIEDAAELERVYRRSMWRFFGFSLIAVLVVQFLPDNTMGWVFGEAWAPSMPYLKYLSFWYAFNFMTSSLSFITLRIQMQRMALVLDALHFVFVFGGIYLAHLWQMDMLGGVKMLVLSKVVYFIINLLVILLYVRKYRNKMKQA
jgi:O-antigen/teichoic acid export membrane protein